ncbi:sugar ABC transporter permease [Nocardioides alkalitolerans]|uniref:sugar ABC transporter permease n=1 Tax=Nocardioides alkalitolerans TaxID=281714 RepID=UPI0003FF9D6A|nr:ABC transporter permease [Nocardioides alkalitolerans]
MTVAADLADERLVQSKGLGGALDLVWRRLRGGDLGSLPVVIGLIVICAVFYSLDPRFLSSFSLVNILAYAAPIGIISLGIVLVLLLGEIDLSVGSVSGMGAAVMAVLVVKESQSLVLGMAAGVGVGVVVGLVYALLYTKLGIPSFVFSLAGLLGFQGVLLYILGSDGTINLPPNSGLIEFARFSYLTGTAAYVAVALVVALYVAGGLWKVRQRKRADLSAPSLVTLGVKAGLLALGLGWLTWYLGVDRGWSYLFLLFAALVVGMDLMLRRTRWGRHVFAVGGNEEAARRSGVKVGRIYVSVFVLTSTLAALGGVLAAGQQTSVSQATGTTDTNLMAIAAAVIGGTSLFGGRGSAYSAMLGIIVLQAIQSGLNIVGVDSSVRFMVTGAVLLLAVAIDSIARRARSSSGRG